MIVAMVLAGGTGSRVGADVPKQFVEVLGKPVIAYTCEIFERNESVDSVLVVSHPDWIGRCREIAEEHGLSKVRWVVPGGRSFQESAMRGVARLEDLADEGIGPDDIVLIHYAGAPFTSQRIVDAVIRMAEERGSAVTGTPCYQLLATRDADSVSRRWVDRDAFIQIACPYGFRLSYLVNLYRRAAERCLLESVDSHTTSLMYALGDEVNYAYGDQTNVKITTAEDLKLFEGWVLSGGFGA